MEPTCFYCGGKDLVLDGNKGISRRKQATLDHIVPLSKGGARFDEENLRVFCEACNCKKGNDLEEVND